MVYQSQKVKLFFTESLEISNGIAHTPPMLWMASKQHLTVFALTSDKRPTEKQFYIMLLFNVYENGSVCMGTVGVDIKIQHRLRNLSVLGKAIFNSRFSHLNHNPTNGNCVSIWKNLIDTDKTFPKEILKRPIKPLKIYCHDKRKQKFILQTIT